MAVVPYLAGASLLGDRTRPGRLGRLPMTEQIDGIRVTHPRAPYVPGGGALLAPLNTPLYVAGLLPHVRSLRGRFDVVLGAYVYPDGCAAAALARILGIPYVIKAHGTDVNVVASWPTVKPLLRHALSRASATVGVSRPMVDRLVELGAPRDRAFLLENGVDRDVFRPQSKAKARATLGIRPEDEVVLFVGRLSREKGLVELFEALPRLAKLRAHKTRGRLCSVFLGEGPLEADVARRAERIASEQGDEAMRVLGARPLEEVALAMAASDLLVLPSFAEGTPNVVLESLAVGRPVVATSVGGIVDRIRHGETGFLVQPGSVGALVSAMNEALDREWSESALVAAAPFSWRESAARLEQVLMFARDAGAALAA